MITSSALLFFELAGKVYDELKLEEYKKISEVMAAASSRVWAIFVFQIFDFDRNGVICSNDIFTSYQRLDEIENKIKLNRSNE